MRKPRQRSVVRAVKQQRRPAAVFPGHRTPSPTPSSPAPAPEPPGRRIRSGSKFFSEEEEELLIKLHALLGNRWSLIAGRLPGRTGTEVESHWNLTMRRKLKRTGVVNHRSMALLEPADDKHANHHLSSNEDCVSDAGSYCPIQQELAYGLSLELTLSTPSLYFRGKEQVTD